MFFSLDSIVNLLTTYKYILLFPIAVIEGPIVSVISGFLSAHGLMSIFIAYAVLVSADIIGDALYYSIGRWGGRSFVHRWGKFFGIDENKVSKMEKYFKEHGGKTLLIGKTQALGGLLLVAAGLSKMSFSRFMWFNIIGTFPKSAILLAIGFFVGSAYKMINSYLGYYAIIATSILLLALLAFYFLKNQEIKKSI